MQAWKKASGYIRYHNWFSDTLELDWTTVNLPDFLADIASALKSPGAWQNDAIRIVPAPKTQPGWSPTAASEWRHPEDVPLRPLAHMSLKDQVVATALMLCLADRVETLQGDPRIDFKRPENRKKVVSYGNRLFCDTDDHDGKTLRHRWGSAKLYRKYFQDYRTFLKRPERVARELIEGAAKNMDSPPGLPFIVCTDLSKFYDRVRPDLMVEALAELSDEPEEQSLFSLAGSLLKWQWDPDDRSEVERYENDGNLVGFSDEVVLPQGLVAAGFFANVVLLGLDRRVIECFGREVMPGIRLHDSCRYVDDIRLVVSTADAIDPDVLGRQVCEWLQGLMDEEAPGLMIEGRETKTDGKDKTRRKTKVIAFGEGTPQLIRIGATMDRIQTAVSGGFDAVEGERILDTVQSLIRSQVAAFADDEDDKWYLSPVPDVRDDTVARFCAGRFRTTYRSLRPLLDAADPRRAGERALVRSREQLDDQARSFALTLIHRWAKDPSNIRVLRIGLDIWPHADALKGVLELLRGLIWTKEQPTDAVRVAWYCLSEIFRAGATETGVVEAAESLHAGTNIDDYRALLRKEATRALSFEPALPWYLRQQAFLYLAATGHVGDANGVADDLPVHYGHLISFLSGASLGGDHGAAATAAVLVRRAFRASNEAVGLVSGRLYGRSPRDVRKVLSAIGARDLSFLDEILEARSHLEDYVEDWLRFELGRVPEGISGTSEDPPPGRSLTEWLQHDALVGPLRNELTLLRFAERFLQQWRSTARDVEVITPHQVYVDLDHDSRSDTAHVKSVTIADSRLQNDRSIYGIPAWCPDEERWRLQLGYLLRFVLAGRVDYTRPVRADSWREAEPVYRPPESHWCLRRYGFFNAQEGFGDDWLPISDWMEDLLLALLQWPGCRPGRLACHVQVGTDGTLRVIRARIKWLEELQGRRTGLLVLPMRSSPQRPGSSIHACVAQTVVPEDKDFRSFPCDPTLGHPDIRTRHSQHLAATLEAIRAMVKARASHRDENPRLDWLILPELAVHPQDIRTHLYPFARVHKTMILTGLTYEKLLPGCLPTNSALWLMPEYSPHHGLQMRTRRQGKQHLTPDEKKLDVEGFRPCQWLIGYPCTGGSRSFRLTASVCYDATDLRLASDLREKSDVLAIPALNKDVKTFDRMALALHYHMFQLVVVANNGKYGGSSAYVPKLDRHKRRIFHLHGQPQMSIAFFEVEKELLERHSAGEGWKHPPAGLEFVAGKDETGW